MSLSNSFLNDQKQRLLEEKKSLEEKRAKFKEYPDFGSTEEDNLEEVNTFENNQAFETEVEFLLEKVNHALKAIENGSYGRCLKCRKAIEENRLEAMPYADICVACNAKK